MIWKINKRSIKTAISLKRNKNTEKMVHQNIDKAKAVSPDDYNINMNDFATKFSGGKWFILELFP